MRDMNLGTRVWHQGGRQQPYLSAGHMKDITSIDSYHVIMDKLTVINYGFCHFLEIRIKLGSLSTIPLKQ